MFENLKALLDDPAVLKGDLDNAVLQNILMKSNQLTKSLDPKLIPMELSALNMLLKIISVRDPISYRHSVRTAHYTHMLGGWMKLGKKEINELVLVGLLHDAGKLGVPEEILNREGELTLREFEVMKQHPKIGAEIIGSCCFHKDVIAGVLHHHERVDGYGYPDEISGDKIPIYARASLITDTFDAMTSNRPYRAALPYEDALEEIKKSAGSQLDQELANVFVEKMAKRIKQMEDEMGISELPKVGRKKRVA